MRESMVSGGGVRGVRGKSSGEKFEGGRVEKRK